MEPIFLTGFMGAGKTTIGKALGKRLALTVFDTDELIEAALAKSIKDIFAEEGEPAFRRYETCVLKKVTWDNVIVTTGGGIVINEVNRKWMKEHGTIVYLHCSPEEVFRRLAKDTERPLIQGKNLDKMSALFKQRQPLYEEADYVLDTNGKSVGAVVEKIAEQMINEEPCRLY
ncbi:MAG TPA: shikimate kinase [Bacillales bacterium]|nr:shikimate kinase [Bacillales bacterium]